MLNPIQLILPQCKNIIKRQRVLSLEETIRTCVVHDAEVGESCVTRPNVLQVNRRAPLTGIVLGEIRVFDAQVFGGGVERGKRAVSEHVCLLRDKSVL